MRVSRVLAVQLLLAALAGVALWLTVFPSSPGTAFLDAIRAGATAEVGLILLARLGV